MPLTRRSPSAPLPLAALQRRFLARVTSRAPRRAGASPTLDDSGAVLGGVSSAEQRIAIYQRGYFARLVECLRDDYPAVACALGPADFEALCIEFIDAHPPASPSLNFYGAPFAAFCATRAGHGSAFIHELARLEWAVVEAIHADAGTALDPTVLAKLPAAAWERARLLPSPALRVVRATHPVRRYYQAVLDGQPAAVPELEPSTVAVCRRGPQVRSIDVEATHARLLERLVAGHPLGAALDALTADSNDDACASLERAFSAWVACGFFAGIHSCAPGAATASGLLEDEPGSGQAWPKAEREHR